MQKKKLDMDNLGHDSKSVAKGRKTDDAFKAGAKGFEPVKKDYTGYNAGNAKRSNLASAMDNTSYSGASRPVSAAQ